MSKYLTMEDHQAIREARLNEGLSMKVIAKRFGVCEATISNVLQEKFKPRHKKEKPSPDMDEEQEEIVDFSQLPDTVLFQHVREFNFIG